MRTSASSSPLRSAFSCAPPVLSVCASYRAHRAPRVFYCAPRTFCATASASCVVPPCRASRTPVSCLCPCPRPCSLYLSSLRLLHPCSSTAVGARRHNENESTLRGRLISGVFPRCPCSDSPCAFSTLHPLFYCSCSASCAVPLFFSTRAFRALHVSASRAYFSSCSRARTTTCAAPVL